LVVCQVDGGGSAIKHEEIAGQHGREFVVGVIKVRRREKRRRRHRTAEPIEAKINVRYDSVSRGPCHLGEHVVRKVQPPAMVSPDPVRYLATDAIIREIQPVKGW